MLSIEATDLRFGYGTLEVLKGITVRIQPGELVALLGPNGVGKTTFIETLLGFRAPSCGDVSVFGHSPLKAGNYFWGRVGVVQQHWADHKQWRVAEHLRWICGHYESSGITITNYTQMLKAVGLEEKSSAKLGQLSGGQRRRVDLASALLGRPELLILDEPTTGLDPASKAQVHDLISAVQDSGTTILFATHDLNEAEKLASRILIMNDGIIAADDTPARLRDQLAGNAEITWFEDDKKFVHATKEAEAFISQLDLTRITGLMITRPTLEDAYLKLIGATS